MKERNGWNVNMEYLNMLFEDIMNRRAMEYSIYKSPLQIRAQNIKGVIRILSGRKTSK